MKFRFPLYALLVFCLTLLGVLWSFPDWERQESMPVFPATIHRDCGPAASEGTAFTVSIPIAKLVIGISIYEAPDVRLPVRFSFPDETQQVGVDNALLFSPRFLPEPLTGKVFFQGVEEGLPVEGAFNLFTEMGDRYKGRFRAEWNKASSDCG